MAETKDCRFFDRDGAGLTLLEWGALWQDPTYRICAETAVRLPLNVSVLVRTVWNGFVDDCVGVRMFSTAYSFSQDDGVWTEARVYDTHQDALAGHQAVCAGLALPSTAVHSS